MSVKSPSAAELTPDLQSHYLLPNPKRCLRGPREVSRKQELLGWTRSVARLAWYPVSDGGQQQMRQRKVQGTPREADVLPLQPARLRKR